MAASIDVRPDTTVGVRTFCHVEVDGASTNTDDGDEIRYRLVASHDGGDHDDLVSPVFAVNADGQWTWDNLMFPVDGAWTVDLVDQDDDSVDATVAVTVE